MPKSAVQQIERVQNPVLWQKFQTENMNLKNKWGLESPIKMLWYGHKEKPVESIIDSEEGFDLRF